MSERSRRIVLHDEEKLKMINPETQRLMKKYKMDMSLRELSEKTIYQYEKDLNQWFIYILEEEGNRSVTELDEDDITEFLYYCKTQGNNVERMKRRMSSISAFYNFLKKKRILQGDSPMLYLDRPKKGLPVIPQIFLTAEQVKEMKQKLAEYGDLQLQTYVTLALSTMARVNALASLKWEKIDFERRICKDVLEKEGKIVDLYFSKEASNLLQKLKKERESKGIEDYGWLFIPRIGKPDPDKPINNGTLNEWAKTAGNLIGVPEIHNHSFRKSGATLLKNAGMPLESVSSLLNHSGTDVTKKYYIKEDASKIVSMKDKFEI